MQVSYVACLNLSDMLTYADCQDCIYIYYMQKFIELLHTVRSMTTPEKIELGRRVRKLPETALDHMVEVVKMRRPAISVSDKVSFNLGRLVLNLSVPTT